ncbi:hypothetical protein N8J89_41230 [Crossiella sp. CA-258035]|uniref:hypothetical protein n=1 Tax=Crossiella sp. CA-258035 TaxID=2981138 RepID=UPI0024BCBBB4|nr:hypothetical protein [Crossiella sp. CA-258035]WHT19435.1 hypothetical protein N8J89_41230 [Crossiella sp. CA-258035]
MRLARRLLALTALLALAAPPAATATPSGIGVADYTLGDSAFRVPDFDAPIELTGVVHYPRRPGRHPLVLLAHGLWESCADPAAARAYQAALAELRKPDLDPAARERAEAQAAAASTKLGAWPCAPGTPPLRNQHGYDYLARELAGQGFVVVSISANGPNAGPGGQDQDRARAALMNKHLALWRDLSATGGGELAGRFTDPATGRPVHADFRGRVDLDRVGTMGHSRGGRGAVWQAANSHRADWPAGVRVRAVVPLAPAEYYVADPEDPAAPEHLDYRITDIPFLAVSGTCDHSVTGGRDYFGNAARHNTVPVRLLTVTGANHNFYNTEWSPASRQLLSHDDVDSNNVRSGPGRCRQHQGGPVRQLSESQQRRVATTYLSAFFRRYLRDDHWAEAIINDPRAIRVANPR